MTETSKTTLWRYLILAKLMRVNRTNKLDQVAQLASSLRTRGATGRLKTSRCRSERTKNCLKRDSTRTATIIAAASHRTRPSLAWPRRMKRSADCRCRAYRLFRRATSRKGSRIFMRSLTIYWWIRTTPCRLLCRRILPKTFRRSTLGPRTKSSKNRIRVSGVARITIPILIIVPTHHQLTRFRSLRRPSCFISVGRKRTRINL